MSASIVSGKNPPAVNEAAIAKVRSDKEREAVKGHDGSWVAGPALIPVAKKAYAHVLGDEKNQIHRVPERHVITAAGLVDIGTKGALTRNGVALNISAGLAYTEAWLAGIGCIAFNGNMEDAATAEISRCQLWQWMKHGASMDDGVVLTPALVKTMLAAEMATVEAKMGAAAFNKSKFHLASTLFAQQIFNADVCAEFLTLDAYPHIVNAITTSKL
jgi:malate synthase